MRQRLFTRESGFSPIFWRKLPCAILLPLLRLPPRCAPHGCRPTAAPQRVGVGRGHKRLPEEGLGRKGGEGHPSSLPGPLPSHLPPRHILVSPAGQTSCAPEAESSPCGRLGVHALGLRRPSAAGGAGGAGTAGERGTTYRHPAVCGEVQGQPGPGKEVETWAAFYVRSRGPASGRMGIWGMGKRESLPVCPCSAHEPGHWAPCSTVPVVQALRGSHEACPLTSTPSPPPRRRTQLGLQI